MKVVLVAATPGEHAPGFERSSGARDFAHQSFGYGIGLLEACVRADPVAREAASIVREDWPLGRSQRRLAREAIDRILAAEPDVVGLSCFCWSVDALLETASEIKRSRPSVRVAAGGPSVSFHARALLERHPCLDLVVRGEAELAFVQLCRQRFERGWQVPNVTCRTSGGSIAENPAEEHVRDLASLPSPYLAGVLAPATPAILLEPSRGCRYRCAFCSWSTRAGPIRTSGAARVRDELRWAIDRGYRGVNFCDTAVNHDTAELERLCEAIRDVDPEQRLSLSLFVRHESLDDRQLRALAGVRCDEIILGLESIHAPVLAACGKPPLDGAALEHKIAGLATGGHRVTLSVMAGLPGDSVEGVAATLDHAEGLAARLPGAVGSICCFWLAVLPGTRFEALRERYGFETRAWGTPYIVRSNDFSSEQLEAVARMLVERAERNPLVHCEEAHREAAARTEPRAGRMTVAKSEVGHRGGGGGEAAGAAGSLGGRVVAAGPVARRRIAELLGLDDPGGRFVAASAAWLDHAVELAVEAGAAQPVVFRVERRTPESRGLVLTARLNVYSRGRDLAVELAERVSRAAPGRLGDMGMGDLAAIVASDAESGRPGLPMPPGMDPGEKPAALLDTWGADGAWADFFAGGEMARSQLDSIDPSRIFRFVQHCDNECLYVNPHTVGTIVSLVCFPWDDRVREPSRPSAQGLGAITDLSVVEDGMVTTDLDENDVVLGNPQRLRDVLDFALSRPGDGDKLLFVSNTCVPTVVGEDVESVVKRARDASGKPILYLTVTPRSMTGVFQGLLSDRRKRAEAAAPPPEPGTVNLVGFPGTRAVRELEELLGRAGVRVNVRVLPELDEQRIDRLPAAAVHVLLPNRTWQHLYDQLLDGTRTRFVAPGAPYGVEATRAWIEQVVGALGRRVDVEACWQEHLAPWRERWCSLRERARDHRLGFVVRDQEAYYLTTPAATWGVPLLAVVEEMGFGIDVLVHASRAETARDAARAIRKMLRDPSRHSIRAFDSFAFLRRRLEDSPSEAFLSYQFFDWRLSEAGKGAFSIQHFEMGAAGAVRTLERLLRVCGTPFYRRYARYLGRSAEGLRVEARSAGEERGG